jgi:hypothetical protein
LGGTTLIWWESKTQADLKQKGKIILSWYEFIYALRKQFYPLAYIQKEMMDWKTLKKNKGQNVQEYTHEFRKRALILGIPLYTQETLFKYICGLHDYLKHTILMFNSTNLDEISVPTNHHESSRRNDHGNFSSKYDHSKEDKNKGKEKLKRTTTVKKDDQRPSCSHCEKKGHDEEHCWKLHPELNPKWACHQKGKATMR